MPSQRVPYMNATHRPKTVLVPRSDRGRASRARLLSAAEESFGERGFAAASVADIVRRAGLSQGSFYVYFPSKESIFGELIDDMAREIRRATREAASATESRQEAEVAGALAFFHWLQGHKHLHRVLHQIDQVDETIAERFYSSIVSGYISGLETGMGTGEIENTDPELLAYALMGISHFVSMRYVLWTDDEFPETFIDDFNRIIRNILGIKSPVSASSNRRPHTRSRP